jgi:hypothetical protein
VRLPEEDWFYQEEPNNVYWFGVVAVYDDDPNVTHYDWGWTNHRHVYNDDAVEGYYDPPGGWFWDELYDQNGVSEDMSFCSQRSASLPENPSAVAWSLRRCITDG